MARVSSEAPPGNVGPGMDFNKAKTRQLLEQYSHMVASLLSTALTMSLVLAVAIFLYGTFYYAYMPVELVNMPVSLEFEPCEGQTSARCTFPTATVALGSKQQMLQGQVYSIKMVLEVPDSPGNEGLGMFMACMNITGQDGAAIARSCKSSISQYRSPMLRSIETLAFAPGLMIGWAEQKQSIPVTFFATFHPDPHAPLRQFHVEVKSKLVQVAHASLHIEANLTGLRHLMYRHSWFSAVLGVGTNILVLMTIIGVSWTRFRQGGAGSMGSYEEEEVKDESEAEEIVEVEELNSPAPPQDEDDLQAVGDQSMCNKLKWFFIRKTLKVFIQCVKALIVVSIAVICFEAFMQGSEANWEKVVTAGKEDVLALANFAVVKVEQLAVAIVGKLLESVLKVDDIPISAIHA